MSDVRWLDVEDDLTYAIMHLSRAVEIFDRGGFQGNDLQAYTSRMSLIQAMQAGYASLETGLERALEILGEEKPKGSYHHADMLQRLQREGAGGRPAVLSEELAKAIDEVRSFGNATRNDYDSFSMARAASAVRSAALIRDGIAFAIEDFRRQT